MLTCLPWMGTSSVRQAAGPVVPPWRCACFALTLHSPPGHPAGASGAIGWHQRHSLHGRGAGRSQDPG